MRNRRRSQCTEKQEVLSGVILTAGEELRITREISKQVILKLTCRHKSRPSGGLLSLPEGIFISARVDVRLKLHIDE